jgi:hypothetical protein
MSEDFVLLGTFRHIMRWYLNLEDVASYHILSHTFFLILIQSFSAVYSEKSIQSPNHKWHWPVTYGTSSVEFQNV